MLAYSTVSQLGYMFMALGAGVGGVAQLAVVAAMFHLFTHAFFKALLFLASGSVMHAMGDVIDMRRFSGLRHRMPYHLLDVRRRRAGPVGIPPLAGFFSKDEILLAPEVGRARVARAGLGLGLLVDLLDGGPDGLPDGVLHRPGVLHDLLRAGEVAQPDDPGGPTTPSRGSHGRRSSRPRLTGPRPRHHGAQSATSRRR